MHDLTEKLARPLANEGATALGILGRLYELGRKSKSPMQWRLT
jgi:hypothetical protein